MCNKINCGITRLKINNKSHEELTEKLDECNECIKNSNDKYKEKTRNILAATRSRSHWDSLRKKD